MKIFVKNLSEKVKADDLRKEAEKFGKVDSVALVKDPKTDKPMGIAYIETPSREEGLAVINGLKGLELKEKKISVKEAAQEKTQESVKPKASQAWQSSKFTGGSRKGFSGGKSNIRIGGANRGR
ncbi:MAG: RNA-binding protein [Spirochaetia bacterium]|nr:RNA-binding protein [Spirochaetia bacterium]